MASTTDWESSLTVSQLEAYLSDEVSTQLYERNLSLKVSVVTSALGPYLRTYSVEGPADRSGDGRAFLCSGDDGRDFFGKAKRECLDILQRLPGLMESLWGVGMPKELGDCCLDRRKKAPRRESEDRCMDKVTVLKSSPFHYRCVCMLHIIHGDEASAGSWVLEELTRSDAGVRNTSKLLGRVYHPTIAECVPQLRRHLRDFLIEQVSIILCPYNKEMLVTIHTLNEANKRPSESSIQAALESSASDLRRVSVNVVAEDTSNEAVSRSGDETHAQGRKKRRGSSKKVSSDYVTDCYHLEALSTDVSLQFKEGNDAIANPTLEIDKLNWMVDAANQCLSRIPRNGRRQLLEVPMGSSNSLESLALGKLFDETVCVIDGHKGKASAAWSKFRLNSMEGEVKVVRGSVSSKIAVLREHQFDMVAIGVDRSGLPDDVRSYLSSIPCIMYAGDYSVAMRGDIRLLSITHKVQQLGLFDTAPFDEGLECCVTLLRRDIV